MNKIIITCICLSTLMSVNSFANQKNTEVKEEIRILKKNTLPRSKADNANFTGEVFLNRIFSAGDPSDLSAGIVEFTAGSRTNWHSHPKGQMLIITSGKGWVQEWGNRVLEVQEGDIVWFPAGVKHWHGASPTSAMSHIAVSPVSDGKSSDWMEKVTNQQYKNK